MKLFCLMLPLALMAKPSGMQTISGNATCSERSGTVVIESGKRAVVKWDEFSIGKGEKVRFAMPDSNSAILNRVSGARSELLGQLDSNGKVYLLNPKGVLIGKDAIINTAGFVASSLDVLDQDFLRGEELLFSGDSQADVINLGKISCLQGDVTLIAHHVANRGKIEGKFVGLATGPKILLKPEGNQRIFIEAKGGDCVAQSGKIQSLVTELRTGSVFDKAICCEGAIEATKIEERGGRIYLVAENGKTNVDGQVIATGGEIQVLGNDIFLGDHAELNVSDCGRAGTILVGGDYRGLNPEIFTATDVVVTYGASAKADAVGSGDGGKIIFWADRMMHHNGNVSVCGGSDGGNGGFIEVSGHQYLINPDVRCDARAPNGKFGTILFDPEGDITISSSPNSGMNTTPYTFSPTSSPAVLNVTTLTNALANGNVIVTTTGGAVTPSGTGTITVADSISWSAATTLELESTGTIDITLVNITNSSTQTGFTAMNFHNDGSVAGSYDGVVVDSSTLSSMGGDIILDGNAVDGIGVFPGNISTTAGNVTVTGSVSSGTSFRSGVSFAIDTTISTTSGNITITGTGNGTGTGSKGMVGSGTNITTESGAILLTGTGGNGTDENSGISLAQSGIFSPAVVRSESGSITLIGNGGAGTFECHGIELLIGSNVESDSGNINLTGNANIGVSSSPNHGIFSFGSSIETATGDLDFTGVGNGGISKGILILDSTVSSGGSLDFMGTLASSTGFGNIGVDIRSASTTVTSTGSGTMTITGQGDGSGSDNVGIAVSAAKVRSTGSGELIFNGDASSGTDDNIGVLVSDAAEITSVSGAITINGNQAAPLLTTGTNNYGVSLLGDPGITKIESLGSGMVTIKGTGGGGTGTNRGVYFDGNGAPDGAFVTSANGAIAITGEPGAATNIGISLVDSSLVDTKSSSGAITLTSATGGIIVSFSEVNAMGALNMSATSPSGTQDALACTSATLTGMGSSMIMGVKTGGTGKGVSLSSSSSITFDSGGTLAGTSIDDDGIAFASGSSFTGTGGLSTLTGVVDSSTIGSVSGVSFDSTSSLLGTGAVHINGTNNAALAFSDLYGIEFDGVATNSGSSLFTFMGTGGAGTTDNYGINVKNGANISCTSSGGITLVGTGGAGSSTFNYGVNILGDASITTVESTGTGSITITGTGGGGSSTNRGVFMDGNGTSDGAVVRSANGRISITGEPGTGTNIGISLVDSSLVESTVGSTGDILFTSASGAILIDSSEVDAMGSLKMSAIGPTTQDAITFTSATITGAGNSVIAGTKTGATGIGVNSSGSMITFLSSGSMTGTGRSSSGVNLVAGSVFTAGTGNVTVRGSMTSTGAGLPGINVATSTIASGSGNLILIGTNSATASSNETGILLDTATVTQSGSGTLTFRGRGGPAVADNCGIQIALGSSLTASDGLLLLDGIGGNGTGARNYGVEIEGTSLITGTGSGRITIEGVGGSGTSDLFGLFVNDGTITSANGNISITGEGGLGTGGASHGIYLLAPSTISSTGSATITCEGTAGSGTASDEGIRIEGAGALITSATGAISLTGNASGTSTTGIHITDGGSIFSTGAAPISLETHSDILLDEGGSVVGGSGLISVDSERDLIVTGGVAAATPSGIFLGSGDARIRVDRNLSLFGGSGAGSFAQIGALTDSSANILFPYIGGLLIVDGVDTNSYALIGHGDPLGGAATFSGRISFPVVRESVRVLGATTDSGGAFGFGQIGHVDSSGIAVDLSGNIFLDTRRSISVRGGTTTASAYARIGHGGQGGTGTFGTSSMNLRAGRNIVLVDQAGVAEMSNLAGNLILVVDNLNRKPPEFGLFGITQDGVLTATGQLRIYTVERSLNTITNPINGEIFSPPVQTVNNSQEEFSIYFPGGDFSTASFRIYYKLPIRAEFPHSDVYELSSTSGGQLQDELPLFRYMRLPNYPFYHANFCGNTREGFGCDPGFDPYGSFIFEDNVYWMGGE
ncbi:MAG: filamentous hemagglutinin N-terminal domain-containing protein [Candidatus Algichlamydia australiensis]|nr:filamentous hemagglutinin N-terminal domain-containing protein [Chlamydiales bacterium]